VACGPGTLSLLARKSGTTLTPQQFAEMIVDDNFPI
jgi:hypothetical protein